MCVCIIRPKDLILSQMRRAIIVISLLAVLLGSCRSHKQTVVRPAPGTEIPAGRPSRPHKPDKNADVDQRVGKKLVGEARRWIGVPYRYGGESRSGVDCSGMVMVIYRDVAGVKLPRSSAAQRDYCLEVSRRQLQPGDLVFFSSSRGGRKISHVGMYVGNGRIIHASSSRGVIESALEEKYYDSHYHSSGRVPGITLAKKNAYVSDEPQFQPATPADVAKNAPVAADKRPASPAREMTLDEFIGSTQPQDADTTAVPAAEVHAAAADTAAAASPAPSPAPADTVGASQPALPGPVVIVDGQRRPSRPQPAARDSVAADSARRADEIRGDVVKAMNFGK